MIGVFTSTFKQSPTRITSKLYRALQKQNKSKTLYAKEKWEAESEIELFESDLFFCM